MSNHAIYTLERELKNLEAEKQRIISTVIACYDEEITEALRLINKQKIQVKESLLVMNNHIKKAA